MGRKTRAVNLKIYRLKNCPFNSNYNKCKCIKLTIKWQTLPTRSTHRTQKICKEIDGKNWKIILITDSASYHFITSHLQIHLLQLCYKTETFLPFLAFPGQGIGDESGHRAIDNLLQGTRMTCFIRFWGFLFFGFFVCFFFALGQNVYRLDKYILFNK